MVGDFNSVTRVIDRFENGVPAGRENLELKDLIKAYRLVDIWIALHRTEPGHTHTSPTGSARLDHAYVPANMMKEIESVDIAPVSFSDHACVTCIIRRNSCPPAPETNSKVWKLNCAILKEDEYVEKIGRFFRAVRTLPMRRENVLDWWEITVKPGIRKISVDYCRQRTQWLNETSAFLERSMLECRMRETSDPGARATREWLESEAQKMVTRRTAGALIRSRAPDVFEDESVSCYHVRRERTQQARASITKICDPSGKDTKDDEEISALITRHFQNLF